MASRTRTLTLGRRGRLALAAAALAPLVFTSASSPAPAASVPAFSVPLPIPETITDADITLTAKQADVQILPGAPTTMWTYNGTFPGPTIRRPSGQPTRVTVVNELPEAAGELSLHHHGAHASSADDGRPSDLLIPTGGSRTYTYEMTEAGEPERGAVQWYHDHRMDVTGRNVWMGLAGMFIVDDPAEQAIDLALPNGAYDVPVLVADRTFDAGNQIPYAFSSEGVNGSTPLVNGAPQPYFEVAARRYRLRLLNASNNRSFNFALSNGRAFAQVGTESGLLPAPVVRNQLLLGPAERADVVVDFAGLVGQDVVLRNTAASGALAQVMQFRVQRDEADPSSIPATLRAARAHETGPLAANRMWVLGRNLESGMWTINGQGFEHHRVDAAPELGKAERWTFLNSTSVDHMVHIHDVDWKIVSRTALLPAAATDVDEAGAKESFRIRPQEVVVVESTFTDHTGRFVWHCHMLEHEDFAMMSQFEVVQPGTAPPVPAHSHSH